MKYIDLPIVPCTASLTKKELDNAREIEVCVYVKRIVMGEGGGRELTINFLMKLSEPVCNVWCRSNSTIRTSWSKKKQMPGILWRSMYIS